ncbi:MAG: complex I NDUFA9 subunit family protein [Pseudomonadota bacterium]
MTKRVTIFGGTGFIGRYIARRMLRLGWQVRLAARQSDPAGAARILGAATKVSSVSCDICDESSVRDALDAADAIVNCVGILVESGSNTFEALQAEAPERMARLAKEQGIKHMVHISAIGADPASDSIYAATKGRGEAAVRDHLPGAVILRPSIVFGREDQFFNRFAAMTKLSPFLPLAGAQTRFQPVYVDDVAQAAEMALVGKAAAGTYELGGPDIASFETLMQRMLGVLKRRRIIISMPMVAAAGMAFGFDTLQKLSLGVFTNNMITQDQLKNLAKDNVVGPDALSFSDLGIEPMAIDAILPTYLGGLSGPVPSAPVEDRVPPAQNR